MYNFIAVRQELWQKLNERRNSLNSVPLLAGIGIAELLFYAAALIKRNGGRTLNSVVELQAVVEDSFKILNGLPNYISFEENQTQVESEVSLENKIKRILSFGEQLKVKRIGAIIHKSSSKYHFLSQLLNRYHFDYYASKVEFQRGLFNIDEEPFSYEWRSIGNETITEEDFILLWSRCMQGSANAASSLSIEEHLSSVKSELGTGWENSCMAVFKENQAVGISIPHLEPGTLDEGRLFYFGLIPEQRGKGLSTEIHYQSLKLLKEMGASYYKGSTHKSNKSMQAVFQKNGCVLKEYVESYYITL
ncbi:RimJ/RimL family protein N-acetyltransferase [Peribacillus deserti]|uniref:RimJ/RimL family protein N-acetyltransferase n=1 Tax=Peribacillus deserti TaxID=673318 RepID=A0ABS2QL34_9BACI|nr:GNAT family N-acetyltransferase [Peribacillus deserti]MBM7693887.1 RimJ/RimL family protein N-acetyltransferase [Peribacillus deserti]